jgi:hypothetical protein
MSEKRFYFWKIFPFIQKNTLNENKVQRILERHMKSNKQHSEDVGESSEEPAASA